MWNGNDYYDNAIDTYTNTDKNRVLQTFFRSHFYDQILILVLNMKYGISLYV